MNEQQLIKLLESAEGTIARLMLEVNRLSKEVELRELTDEEIDQIIKQHDWYSKTWVDMVRSIESAILKKSSEK